MTKRRFSAAVCGLSALIGLGTMAITRAQQPATKAEAPRSAKESLRARIVALRAEVAVLDLEREAMRAGLSKTLQAVEEADVLGIDYAGLMGMAKLELGGLTGSAESLKEMSDMMKLLDSGAAPPSLPEALGGKPPSPEEARKQAEKQQAVLPEIKKGIDKQRAEVRAGIERKKREYADKVRALTEKALDLEQIEQRYRMLD